MTVPVEDLLSDHRDRSEQTHASSVAQINSLRQQSQQLTNEFRKIVCAIDALDCYVHDSGFPAYTGNSDMDWDLDDGSKLLKRLKDGLFEKLNELAILHQTIREQANVAEQCLCELTLCTCAEIALRIPPI